MALLHKLFQGRKTFRNNSTKWNPNEGNAKWKSPKLDRDKIRLIIFGDNDRRGRQLLFDSKAVQRIEDKPTGCGRSKGSGVIMRDRSCGKAGQTEPQKQGPKYQLSKPGSDIKMLEEMMFGSVAMSFKGSAMKVHFIKAPAQLLLTKVFIPEKPKPDSMNEQDAFDTCSLASSSGDISQPKHISGSDKSPAHVAQSIPMDVPSAPYLDMTGIDEDSGLASMTSSGSFQTSLPSPSNSSSYSSSSFNSLHRRWMRNQTTSLEACFRKRCSSDLLNSTEVSPAHRKSKLAVGILFDLFDDKDKESNELFQNFFFSHITLFEGHVEKLKAAIERGYYNKRYFVHIVMEALDMFRRDVFDLYTAPRLSEPVWLNMMAYSNYRYVLCEQFMKELMAIVAKFDNKNTNFFVSTLVTAVLTHHLAWVPTVTPAGGTPSKTYLDKHSAKWLDTLAKNHPYNPLWAQLSDLYGAIGFPLRTARTVVVGKKADLVNKFLYILSYFIRCSEVHENNSSGLLSGNVDDLIREETPGEGDKTIQGWITLPEESDTSEKPTGGDWSSLTSSSGPIVPTCQCIHDVERTHPSERKSDSCHCQKRSDAHIYSNESHCMKTTINPLQKAVESQDSCGSRPAAGLCDNTTFPSTNSTATPNLVRVPLLRDNSKLPNEIGASEETQICRVFSVMIDEKPKIEDLRHVRKECDYKEKDGSDVVLKLYPQLDSLDLGKQHCLNGHGEKGSPLTVPRLYPTIESINTEPPQSPNGHEPNSGQVLTKGRSLLSEQLAVNSVMQEESLSKTSPVNNCDNAERRNLAKMQFLEEGSHSMFDEYFEDESITNTLDDINSKDIVMTNPLLKRLSSSSMGKPDDKSNSTESLAKKSDVGELCQGRASRAPVKQSVSRQTSFGSDKPPAVRPTTLAPGRCRSVTPTELGRRRHLSSTSSFDCDLMDPLVNCKEVPLWRQNSETVSSKSIKTFERNFGRSLMAGYSDHYLPDFVLHGTSESDFRRKLTTDLNLAVQHPVLDEPVTEAVCVIADTDNWTVEVMSSAEKPGEKWVASQLVCNLLESVHSLWKLKMSPEFCLMHLEDRLQEIFFKSHMLMEYFRGLHMSKTQYNQKDLANLLGLDSNNTSDLQLLLSIAGTNSPMPS